MPRDDARPQARVDAGADHRCEPCGPPLWRSRLGWLVGLPLTSAPIAAFLAVEQGPRFAAGAAIGSLSGAAAEGAFCLAYARLAQRGIVPAFAAGTLAFAALGGAAIALSWSRLLLFAAALAAFAVALLAMPRGGALPVNAMPPARWDLPARAVVATALVLLLTGVATTIGARLTGLLAVYPVYAAVLTVFAHRSSGPGATIAVLRGVVPGLFAFATFFFVLASLLGRIDTAAAFVCATSAALVVQALSYIYGTDRSASLRSSRDASPGLDDAQRAGRRPDGEATTV